MIFKSFYSKLIKLEKIIMSYVAFEITNTAILYDAQMRFFFIKIVVSVLLISIFV